jgi:predicted ATP-dependent serine protease
MTAPSEWIIWDAADLQSWKAERLEWLVEPLVPKGGLGFISGQPKLGKSFLALDMSLHIARSFYEDVLWLGKFRCQRGRILYISREDPLRRLRDRAQEIMAVWPEPFLISETLRFLVRDRFQLTKPAHIAWIGDQVSEFQTEVLVLDVLNRMTPDLDENSAKDIVKLWTFWKPLTVTTL